MFVIYEVLCSYAYIVKIINYDFWLKKLKKKPFETNNIESITASWKIPKSLPFVIDIHQLPKIFVGSSGLKFFVKSSNPKRNWPVAS